MKKPDTLLDYLLENFFYQFFNNFLELLISKINVLDIFNVNDFLGIFNSSQSPGILIDPD